MYVNAKMILVENIPGTGMLGSGIKESGREDEFKYDRFEILYELLQMSQCTPTQHNNKKQNIANKVKKKPVTHTPIKNPNESITFQIKIYGEIQNNLQLY
jgi:hypothetical protein